MKLNLSHNTIIRETVTDSFLRYFQQSLVPLLSERYGESLAEVQMYESHLEKELSFGGEWYYPLSLRTDAGDITQWVAWEYPKNGAFLEMNPYAYVSGAPLAFRLADDVPQTFISAVGRRTPFAPSDALPISVGVAPGDVRMLVGKYSQSFLDALSCALTREIERVHGVRGLSSSGIRLEMLFAPATYMEHTCEGVTYRRLTVSEEGARATKDFWVRWQRTATNEPVTVSDDVQEGEVAFYIGEDVPQKVREKEYRYLLRQNAEKYRSSMGRKTVTEWRELLKKALKRGALMRVDALAEATSSAAQELPLTYETPLAAMDTASAFTEPEAVKPIETVTVPAPVVSEPTTDVAQSADDPWLARLKEYAGEKSAPAESEDTAVEENTDEFRDAMMRMRSILGISEAQDESGMFSDENMIEQDEPAPENNEDIAVGNGEESQAEGSFEAEERTAREPLFTKPVQEEFFVEMPKAPEKSTPPAEDEPAVRQESDEAQLRRQIREGVLREIEMRERDRLAEEARRAVAEKEEREAEMARIAKERMEAEASRRELEELREQTRALSEELRRAHTQIRMDVMSALPAREVVSVASAEESTASAAAPAKESVAPVQEQISFTVPKTAQAHETLAQTAEEESVSEQTQHKDEPKRYSFTEDELAALLREHTERIEQGLREQARRIAMEELEKERAALNRSVEQAEEKASGQTPAFTEDAPAEHAIRESDPQSTEADAEQLPAEVTSSVCTEDFEKTSTISEPQAQIADLLLRNTREQEEEERRVALEALIHEQEERLVAMRREEEERRVRAEQLIAEQARLEELARIERERAEEENRRLEEERKRAEEIALQSYEKHLIEAKRLEDELEAARRRREEEDLRIAQAERRIAEQNRLAEEAREQQRIKNEEARRLAEEAQQRLCDLDAARERGRELAERTEEESRLMQQSLREQEERLRADAIRRQEEERQRVAAERLVEQRREVPSGEMLLEAPQSYNYVSRVVHLYFGRAIDPNVIGQIHRLMSDTIAYFNKSHVSISVRAEIVGATQLDLNFIRIPKEEEPLLINIVKVLGRSNIGVRRASIDD